MTVNLAQLPWASDLGENIAPEVIRYVFEGRPVAAVEILEREGYINLSCGNAGKADVMFDAAGRVHGGEGVEWRA
jgi:hypothetical protein